MHEAVTTFLALSEILKKSAGGAYPKGGGRFAYPSEYGMCFVSNGVFRKSLKLRITWYFDTHTLQYGNVT